MRTEHHLFHVLGIAPYSRAKVCAQWKILESPHPHGSILLTTALEVGDIGVVLTSCELE